MTLRTKIEEAIANILAYDPLHKDERQGGYTGHSNCDIDYPRARKELADQICTIFEEELEKMTEGIVTDESDSYWVLEEVIERKNKLLASLKEGKEE